MTGPCRWPGLPCPDQATTVVRIADVGARAICDEHVAVLDRLGMHYTIQAGSGSGPDRTVPSTAYAPLPAAPLARRIAALTPASSWRPAWLRQGTTKDLTGGLR